MPPDKTLILPFYCTHKPRPCASPLSVPRIEAMAYVSRTHVDTSGSQRQCRHESTAVCYSTGGKIRHLHLFRRTRKLCDVSPRTYNHRSQTTYQYQPRNVLLAWMSGACHGSPSDGPQERRCFKLNTHSNPSMLRISTPSFTADYVVAFQHECAVVSWSTTAPSHVGW